MKNTVQIVRRLASAFVALTFFSAAATVPTAFAQANKPLRIIVSFSAGGPVDFVARTLAEPLGRELNRTVIVENKPGANMVLGAMEVLRAEPDGNTVWITSVGAAAINPSLQPNLPYDTRRDFAPVSLVVNNVEVFVVHKDHPARDAADFIRLAKASRQPLPIASSGVGSIPHLALLQLEAAAQVPFLHVPYKGMSLALTDLLGGQFQGVFADVPAVIKQIEAGNLKALGIAAGMRNPVLPHVKTFQEQGLRAVDSNNWYALFVPAATPTTAVDTLNRAVRKVLANAAVAARLRASGAQPQGSTPQELAALLQGDTDKWAALIRSRNITP